MREYSSTLNFGTRKDLVKSLRNICDSYSDIFSLVVLFGSTARGNFFDKSDIDLYIESDKMTTTQLLRNKRFDCFTLEVYNILGGKGIDFDLVSKGENEIKASRGSLLYSQIEKDGVVL